MVNNNKNLTAKIEIVQEIENYQNNKKSPLSPAARNKVINRSGSNYSNKDREGYEPMYHGGSSSDNQFSIEYKFSHGGGNEKLFFEISGGYTSVWNIKGNLWKLRDELRKLENGEIRVFNLVQGRYRRDWDEEETVKKSLRETIRKCEEVRNLEPGVVYCMSQTFSKII